MGSLGQRVPPFIIFDALVVIRVVVHAVLNRVVFFFFF